MSPPDDFVIARNPEEGTTLPYLLRIPLGPDGIVLKAKCGAAPRSTWSSTAAGRTARSSC